MEEKTYKFHHRIYRLLLPLVKLFVKLKFDYTYDEPPELPESYILLSNHVTDFDLLFAATALKRHMYFVGSEHIYSAGIWSKLLKKFFDPIPRPKGGSAVAAVRQILRRAKDGQNICLFAEGNCSWDGENSPILASTGKMCRTAKVPMVTFRIEGGYFVRPRWAYSLRRGPIHGRVVNIYSAEQLQAMTPAEVNAAINSDLHENAYEHQLVSPKRYRGRKLAEGIEHTLIMCPNCGGIDTIKSRDDSFFCACGLKGRYDENGMLSGEGFDFSTILEWSTWQKARIAELPESAEETEYTHDDELELCEVNGHDRRLVSRGRAAMTNRAFKFPAISFPHSEISDMAVRTKGTVTFTVGDKYYELRSVKGRPQYSGRKYELLHAHFGKVRV